jgi:DNA topoisomerase VI subunit B
MEICESIGLSKMTIDCLEEMMNLHEARGELGKALAVARELKAKQEDHLNRENLQRIAELQVQYETERKEQESEIYRLKNVELEKKNEELSQALEHVRRLQGMLPICSHCKKIRDDSGYWEQIESYISKHSETEFSHSICPECLAELYEPGDGP